MGGKKEACIEACATHARTPDTNIPRRPIDGLFAIHRSARVFQYYYISSCKIFLRRILPSIFIHFRNLQLFNFLERVAVSSCSRGYDSFAALASACRAAL